MSRLSTLDAGHKLNVRIAEQVMGLRHWPRFSDDVEGYWCAKDHTHGGSPCESCVISEEMPDYSGDIAAAWLVVAHMRDAHGYLLTLEQFLLNSYEWEDWRAVFEHRETCESFSSDPDSVELIVASMFAGPPAPAPLAICRAALAASASLTEGEQDGAA